MTAYQNQEVEEYVAGLSDLQRELVLEIREVVLGVDNRIKEGMKWGSIAFFNQKNICGYRVAKAHVSLVFMDGAHLPDPEGMFTSGGSKSKSFRHDGKASLNVEGLKGLVKAALEAGS